MKTVQVNGNTILALGRQGENLARQVVFDLSDWVRSYGDGVAELICQRPGDDRPYPAAAVREGSTLVWTVSSLDTAVATTGHSPGHCELRWYVGDVLAKSQTWYTWVEPAMDTPSETAPPAPEQGWVEQVLDAGAQALDSAQRAETAAKRAETAIPAGSLSIGNGLKWAADGKLAVDTTDHAEKDNTRPMTSAGVYTLAGNIEVLLAAL